MYKIIDGQFAQDPSINESIGSLPKEQRQSQGWFSKFIIDELIEVAFEDIENDCIHIPPNTSESPIIPNDLIDNVIGDIKNTYNLTDEELKQIMEDYIAGNS